MNVREKVLDSVPERIHPLLTGLYFTMFPMEGPTRPHRLDSVPDSLPEEHFSNIEVVATREDLLEHLPSGGTVSEIGVASGYFASKIHQLTDPDTLHLVDLWNDESDLNAVTAEFEDEIARGDVVLHQKDSLAALRDFEDDHFDWVYIDTTHLYRHTLRELELSERKVKPGGLIAGHDYSVGNWPTEQMNGVIPAVHQFCVDYDWELKYMTLESNGIDSFAVKQRES